MGRSDTGIITLEDVKRRFEEWRSEASRGDHC